MSDETTPETTPENGATSTELVELEAPPAPPTRHDRPSTVEGETADEDGAGTAAPAPSSTPDYVTEEDVPEPSSAERIRDRLRTLEERRHPSSAGFGISGKFEGARADRDAQDDDA